MSQSEDKYNQQWRDLFEGASEAPPEGLWDKIEEKLDKKKTKKGIIWWKQSPYWYAAASLLLFVGLGYNYLSNSDTNTQTPISENTSETIVHTDRRTDKPSNNAISELSKNTPLATTTKDIKSDINISSSKQHNGVTQYKSDLNQTAEFTPNHLVAASANSIESKPITETNENSSKKYNEINSLEISPLETQNFIETPVYFQQRFVYRNQVQNVQIDELKQVNFTKKADQYWAGINIMPASFDPNLRVNTTNVYSASVAYQRTNEPENAKGSIPNLSIGVSAQGGVKINKNWAIETGISFFQGNSGFKNKGMYLDKTNNTSTNLLVSALQTSIPSIDNEIPNNMLMSPNKNGAEYLYVSKENVVQNNFQYLQLPAYISYTFLPEKKVNYTLLGGGIANLFLKNDLELSNSKTLQTRTSNEVYNLVNWSAGTGVRVNYKMNEQWSTNLTGSFQKSMMSTFKNNDILSSKPQVYGVSWGLRYEF